MRLLLLSVSAVLGIAQTCDGQGYPPEQATRMMQPADDLAVELVASEPEVRQPVCIEFDDRGRLWVIQYLQYPNPEGLKRVQVDRYSRTRYDRFPDPPPRGPRGSDRITILDGVTSRTRTVGNFVEGLNLATGIAFGYDGVFVLNVPYLLFYPDRDRNDVPDSDPEVLLSGFGMEDAHSVANSLTWGPDGWLYGCQGSTVTANIRGIEFQQGVWRYHPRTHAFELFCEGGGNAWGLDFDAQGNLLYSTNYGGFVCVHGVQGGNYVKSFAKHGQLHNPYAYGYLEHTPHTSFQGGHVTVGGLVYQGSTLPTRMHGQYIAGDLLGHAVRMHELSPVGGSFRSSTVDLLLDSRDTWFAPTDLITGPDGNLYVSDWHDARTAHPDPDASWDRSNGRIYRLRSKPEPAGSAKGYAQFDFTTMSLQQLMELHQHPNQWWVRRMRAEFARRASSSFVVDSQGKREFSAAFEKLLQQALHSEDKRLAIESLWTVLTCCEHNHHAPLVISDEQFVQLLKSPHAAVRFWAVRALGDRGTVSVALAHELDAMAETEKDLRVRQQLAASAARLPAHVALPIINANINRREESLDNFLTMSLWWALERHAIDGRAEVMRRFTRPTLWQSTLGRQELAPRLLRRFMAEYMSTGDEIYLDCIADILRVAKSEIVRFPICAELLAGMSEGAVDDAGRRHLVQLAQQHPLSTLVQTAYASAEATTPARELINTSLALLSVRLGNLRPVNIAVETIGDTNSSPGQLESALSLLLKLDLGSETDNATDSAKISKTLVAPAVERLQSIANNAAIPLSSRKAAWTILFRYDEPRATWSALDLLSRSAGALEGTLLELVMQRRAAALELLEQLAAGNDAIKERIPIDQVRQLAMHNDSRINDLVRKLWGKLDRATPEEKLAEVRRLNNDLRAATGNVTAGSALFKKHCAACHQFFGEGGKIGPDLTTANRADRDFLLVSLVDPSSVIRKEYLSSIVLTDDGRVLTGIVSMIGDGSIHILNAKNEISALRPNEIAEMKESPQSLMPDDIYKQLSPQELRDLFAYLQQGVTK